MNNPVSHSGHFSLLDGLRGVASIVVLFYHIDMYVFGKTWFPHAYLAVDFFFVLSGFVIANAYGKKLLDSMTFMGFVKVRLARLYPLIFISVFLGLLILGIRLLTTHSLSYWQLFVAAISGFALMPTNILEDLYPEKTPLYPVNGPLWSLFFELFINFVFAAIVRWLSVARVAFLCVASGVALLFVAVHHKGVDVGFTCANFPEGFVRVTFSFFIGILLGRFKPSFHAGDLVGMLLMFLLAAFLFLPFFAEKWLYDMVAVAIVFPLIVYGGISCRSTPVIGGFYLFLGELSYPLYVIHDPTNRLVSNALNILHFHPAHDAVAVLCGVAAFATAILLMVFWDRPVRKLLGRMAGPSLQTQ